MFMIQVSLALCLVVCCIQTEHLPTPTMESANDGYIETILILGMPSIIGVQPSEPITPLRQSSIDRDGCTRMAGAVPKIKTLSISPPFRDSIAGWPLHATVDLEMVHTECQRQMGHEPSRRVR